MPKKKKVAYYFDSVVVSNFALSKSLFLLIEKYGNHAFLTSQVLDELANGIASGYESLRVVLQAVEEDQFSTAQIQKEEINLYTSLLRTLGSGEASIIAIAKSRGGLVVTDDRSARRASEDLGLSFTGTIGILLRLCKENILTPEKADAILEIMIEKGFYSPVTQISALL